MTSSNIPRGAPIERYSGDPEIAQLWLTKEGAGKFAFIHKVEIALAAALANARIIPLESAQAIAASSFDAAEIIAAGGHDINAYITSVRKTLPESARGDFHRGATSFDVQDTGFALMYLETLDILVAQLDELESFLLELARKHKDTLMIGRTHSVHAKPITFALKVLNWVWMIQRAMSRLNDAKESISRGKVSGAVGVYTLDPQIESLVCEQLGLRPAEITTQILPRDLHADFFHAITCAAAACESIATEIRHLHRTEIREVMEPFPPGMKGSSAMPHKRNAEVCELICGLARVVRNDQGVIYENITTWNERSIEQSSAERLTHTEMIVLTSHIVLKMTLVIEGLQVFPKRMLANMDLTRGAIYAEAINLRLRDKGMDPEVSYRLLQAAAIAADDGEGDLRSNLLANPQFTHFVTAEELDELMDPWKEVQYRDVIYERFGI